MGIFGEDIGAQLNALRQQMEACEAQRKEQAQELAAERKRSAQLVIELEKAAANLEAAQHAVLRMRARQKNSVERANRLKTRLVEISNQGGRGL